MSKINESLEVFYVNNVKIVNIKNSNKTGVFSVYIENGSIYERRAEYGYAHLLEHMFFNGTQKMSASEIDRKFANLCAITNAYTANNNTCYSVDFLPERAKESITLFLEMIFDATFEASEIEKEKGIIVEELNANSKSIEGTFDERRIDRIVEKKYSRDVAGSKKSVNGATREGLLNYLKRTLHNKSVVLICCGNVTNNDLIQWISESVNCIGNSFASREIKSDPVFKEPFGDKNYKLEVKKNIVQSKIVFTSPPCSAYGRFSDAETLLYYMLGGESYSLLYDELRVKRGLCYEVFSDHAIYRFPDALLYEIQTGVSHQNVDKCVDAMQAVFDKIAREGVDREFFEVAKKRFRSDVIRSSETSMGQTFLLSFDSFFKENPITIDEKLNAYDDITMEECMEVARTHFTLDKNCWSVLTKEKS